MRMTNHLSLKTQMGIQTPLISLRSLRLSKKSDSVECVILNACSSIKNLTTPISEITIGMDEAIDDQAAIEFSRGF